MSGRCAVGDQTGIQEEKTCLQEEKRLAAGKRAETERPVFPGATPTEMAPPTLSDGRLKLLPLRQDLCPTSRGSTFIKLDVWWDEKVRHRSKSQSLISLNI